MNTLCNIINKLPEKAKSWTPTGAICGNGDLSIILDNESNDLIIHMSKCDFWKFSTGTHGSGGIKTLGIIRVKNVIYNKYEIVQTFDKGLMACDFGNSSVEIFVSPENCIYLTISAPDNGNFPLLNIEMAESSDSDNYTYADSGLNWYLRKFDGDNVVLNSGVSVCCRRYPSAVQNGHKSVSFCVSVVSNFDSDSYVSKSIQLVVDSDIEKAKRDTQLYWSKYFSLSKVTLNDKVLEKAYNGSLYLLGCCTGNNIFPPGLFGNFIVNDDVPWCGDYHLNYNFEAPFYCLFSSNRIQNAECYIQPLLDMIDKGKDFAKFENCKGIYFPVNFGPKALDLYSQKDCKEHGILFLGQKSNAAYGAVIPVMHWYSTYDNQYAKDKLYPYIRQVADFWEDYLAKEKNRYVIKNDAIHEIPYYRGEKFNYFTHKSQIEAKNNILSLGLVKMVFKCIIDMSKELEINKDKLPVWQDIVDNLSEFPTFIKRGKRCFRYTEKGPSWRSDNSVGLQHIYPASQIGFSSDKKILKIARNTYFMNDRRLDDNGSVSYLPCGARLGVNPDYLTDGLKMNLEKFGLSNMLFDRHGGCIEHLSTIPSTVNEMLMQSHEGVIRLFPCWNRNSDASFENLRAYGAFLVSSELKNGKICLLSVKSLAGRTCRLQIYDNFKFDIRQSDGKKIKYTKIDDNCIEFKTQPDVTYIIA